MSFAKRLAFYLGGFSIGLILLFFFLSGKRTSCDYGPDARVLKNISTKNLIVSEQVLEKLHANDLDTAAISMALKDGNVLFRESNTKLDSCRTYVIKQTVSEKLLKFKIANCQDQAKVMGVQIDH